ncbi:MAG: hypothetical protein V7739_16620 [Motiliproteus sp.]
MHEFGVDCLLADAVKILEKVSSVEDGCGCAGLSFDDCERLHAIHDELVDLDCDDVIMLAQIANLLMPCERKKLHR